MKIEPILLERILDKERDKLSVSACILETPPESSGKYFMYKREDSPSNFYNSKNIRTQTFYKNTSLFISSKMYKSLQK